MNRYQADLLVIKTAMMYASLDGDCTANQLQCCPGQSDNQCSQRWCDGFFTPTCMPKSEWCYSQVGLAVGVPFAAIFVIGIICVIVAVNRAQQARQWGATGTKYDVNNPAHFR